MPSERLSFSGAERRRTRKREEGHWKPLGGSSKNTRAEGLTTPINANNEEQQCLQ